MSQRIEDLTAENERLKLGEASAIAATRGERLGSSPSAYLDDLTRQDEFEARKPALGGGETREGNPMNTVVGDVHSPAQSTEYKNCLDW